eukprot:7882447-Pyramimonas_sp.AAC.1
MHLGAALVVCGGDALGGPLHLKHRRLQRLGALLQPENLDVERADAFGLAQGGPPEGPRAGLAKLADHWKDGLRRRRALRSHRRPTGGGKPMPMKWQPCLRWRNMATAPASPPSNSPTPHREQSRCITVYSSIADA